MDPTKNFDHLDPKLKDTYARVMGTAPAGTGDTAPVPIVSPTLAATPGGSPVQDSMNQPLSPVSNPNTGPNPGTGPTINSIPTDTSTIVAQSVTPAPAETPAIMNAAPATSSFFSNPSPATTDPTQTPVQTADNNISAPFTQVTEPSTAPVTPYTPDNQTQYAPPTEQVTQPLPSPSSVVQSAQKQTSPLLRVLYILAAVIFFVIYTVFWAKVFGLPIPFLNF